MVIENVEVVNKDPAIIEVTFEPIPQKIIDLVYAETQRFEQLSFDDLVVEQGRTFYTGTESNAYKVLKRHFVSAFQEITKQLLLVDPIRFPIMYQEKVDKNKALDKWYESNNLKNHQSLLCALDYTGFHQGTHLDNRFAMWAGIINLQDNSVGTHHYPAEFDRTPYYVASGKKFKGTFWLNTEKTWHGVPFLQENRRVLVCNQMWISTLAFD